MKQLFILTSLLLGTWLQAQVAIVSDGAARAEIVTAADAPPMVALAAQELQTYLRRISGAELPIVHQPSGEPVAIYVGESAYTRELGIDPAELKYDAYIMRSGENWLALLGDDERYQPIEPAAQSKNEMEEVDAEWDSMTGEHWSNYYRSLFKTYSTALDLWSADDRGTINAVYAFLRDLGVRWYFPGEIGEVVPQQTTIHLPKLDRTVRPDFAVRNPRLYYNEFFRNKADETLWQLRLGLNDGSEMLGHGPTGHGINPVHARDEVKAAHPEFYAIWGGQRMTEGAGKPCLSSTGLKQQNIAYLRAMFDHYPDRMIDVSPADGYMNLCECDKCEGKQTLERGWNGQLSDYVWTYVNDIAKEVYKTHPDRMIRCLAYTSYQLPPASIEQLSPNVAVIFCRWRANFVDPQTRQKFLDLREAWKAKLPSGEFYIWDYYLHPRRNSVYTGIPVVFSQIIAQDLQSLKGFSQGEFIEVQRNWPAWEVPWRALAANHLNLYVTSRYYWDADQELEPLLDEYFRLYYGPAAEPMRELFTYAEENWPRATQELEVIDRLMALGETARDKAGNGIYGERVQTLVDFMKPLKERRAVLAQGREGVPEVTAVSRERSPTLDGKLDEPFWQGLESHSLKALQTGDPAPEAATRFKIAWADDSLYLGIVCDEPQMDSLVASAKKDEDTNIWLGDCIELLVETATHVYYQIAISPNGYITDLDRQGGFGMGWSSNAKVAAVQGDNQWVLEMRLPAAGAGQDQLDALNGVSGGRPSAQSPWYFNVCRQRPRGDDRQLSAFAPTESTGFHKRMKFARLEVR